MEYERASFAFLDWSKGGVLDWISIPLKLSINREDFFEACMIIMKGYLIDIEDPDDRNFKKIIIIMIWNSYIFWLCPNLVEYRRIIFFHWFDL